MVSFSPALMEDGVRVRVAFPGSTVTLPPGGTVTLPPGGTVTLPPGGTVTLPVVAVSLPVVCADASGATIAKDAIAKPATNRYGISNFLFFPVMLDIMHFVYQ